MQGAVLELPKEFDTNGVQGSGDGPSSGQRTHTSWREVTSPEGLIILTMGENWGEGQGGREREVSPFCISCRSYVQWRRK